MFTKYIIPNFITALAYTVSGCIGLSLFITSPTNVAVICPASGIALASVLIYGYRVLPGVFIASFVVESIKFLELPNTESLIMPMIAISIIASGAFFQTLIGAKLTEGIIAKDKALLKERNILSFYILAGPISCITSASFSVVAMSAFGIEDTHQLSQTWISIWISHSIGVLIFTPLLLCFFGKPRYYWKQRILTVALPLFIISTVAYVIFKVLHFHEMQYLEKVFTANTYRFHNDLEHSIEVNMNTAVQLKEFYDSTNEVSYREFASFTRPKLKRYPEISALEWIAYVDHGDRARFEFELGEAIKIPFKEDAMQVSPGKDFYYVIEHVEPYRGNENAFGYDIRDNVIARNAAENACKTGKVSATDAIKLVQETQQRFSVVFYAPVYKKNGANSCDNLLGFATSIYRLQDEINNIYNELFNSELSIKLTSNSKIIHIDDNYNEHDSFNINFKKTYRIPVADNSYEISFLPTNAFFIKYSSWRIWLILSTGILLSSLFSIGLLMLSGRALRTEELVQVRTEELNNEITERKHTEKLLTLENKYLEMITQDYSLKEITDSICIDVETFKPGALCSLQLIDNTGLHLIKYSAPSLPEEYIDTAVNNLKIGPNVCSCGTSAYLNKAVIVSDIANDSLWEDYKHIALKFGLKACWSIPIGILNKNVLGTFSVYFMEVKEADINTIELIQRMVNITAVAILRKQTEDKLNFNASHDALTGLVNRREFETQVQHILESVYQGNESAICFLDLDQFKVVNDTCGHVAGDELLRQLTAVLSKVVRKHDTLARLGGDEFGVLMQHCSLDDAERVAKSILTAIQNYQFIWEDNTFKIGVSIGLAPITQTTASFAQLLKDADAACYMAKELGRNRIYIYQDNDESLVKRSGEMQWITHINDALDDDLFTLYAQAIEPLHGNTEKHYELLIRMTDVNGTLFPPGAFLPAAERYNLISRIDRWVINNALEALANNPEFVKNTCFCSINLSGQTLSSSDMLDFIISQLLQSKIDANKICFEVTETAAISNLSIAIEFISKLKNMGCRFALDDFGSGLSSFAYLKNLPVDFLKIDGIFVKDIADDAIDHAMVKSINEIGQVMGMQTIAEFVENDLIKGMLKEIGVNYAQGYGIGKPEPFNKVLQRYA